MKVHSFYVCQYAQPSDVKADSFYVNCLRADVRAPSFYVNYRDARPSDVKADSFYVDCLRP